MGEVMQPPVRYLTEKSKRGTGASTLISGNHRRRQCIDCEKKGKLHLDRTSRLRLTLSGGLRSPKRTHGCPLSCWPTGMGVSAIDRPCYQHAPRRLRRLFRHCLPLASIVKKKKKGGICSEELGVFYRREFIWGVIAAIPSSNPRLGLGRQLIL